MSMQSDYDILQDKITKLMQEHKRRNGVIDVLYVRAIEQDVLAMVDAGLIDTDDIGALILDLERKLGWLTDNVAVRVLERAKDLIKVQQYFWLKYGYTLDLAKEYQRLQAIQANAFDEFAGIPKDTGELIRQMLRDNEIMGKGKDAVVQEIRRIAGVSSSRAKQIAGTSEFLYVGQFNANRAEELGVQRWEYKPDFVIKTSRPFSRWAVRKKYFTKSEIQAIDDQQWEFVLGIPLDETGKGWQGQIPGVPVLVQGGGYNTIHRFAMVF